MHQQALTEGAVEVELERGPAFLAQSCPFLEARAAKNLFFHPSFAAEGVEGESPPLLQAWSAGKRCLRHTLMWQVLQVLVLENVRTCLQRFTGQMGFFFLLGSQFPELWCLSKIAASASSSCCCPIWPVVSMDMEHASQTTTFLLLWSGFGHKWDL